MIKALVIAAGIFTISMRSYAFDQWNVTGTSCVADAASIRDSLYVGTGGTVKFAAQKVGNIVLYCPVAFNLGFKPTVLGMTYYDDTAAVGNHVSVQFIKMEIGTGALTKIVTIDSDIAASITSHGNASLIGQEFEDAYDPKNFAYYSRIDIIRNSPTANETIYAVSLLK